MGQTMKATNQQTRDLFRILAETDRARSAKADGLFRRLRHGFEAAHDTNMGTVAQDGGSLSSGMPSNPSLMLKSAGRYGGE